MRNAMNSGFLSPVMPEGGPAFARPGSTDERLGGYQYGYAFSPGPSATPSELPSGGFDQQSDAFGGGGLQGTQDMAPMPTMADLPPLPSFSTMAPFLPYQQEQLPPLGYTAAPPRNYMARSAYARPPMAPYGRYRGNASFGGYGGAYGRGAGAMGGLSQYGGGAYGGGYGGYGQQF